MNYSLEPRKLNTIRITSLVHGLGSDVMLQEVRAFSSGLVALFLSKFITVKFATDWVASLWRFWGYRPVNPQLINKVVCKIVCEKIEGSVASKLIYRIVRQATFSV